MGVFLMPINKQKNAPKGAFFNGVILENLESKFCKKYCTGNIFVSS